jgi:uncharacterized membrane protein
MVPVALCASIRSRSIVEQSFLRDRKTTQLFTCDSSNCFATDYNRPVQRSAKGEKSMQEIMMFVAVFAAAMFTGAAVYINLVEHPARLECGTEVAARQWAPSYRRATVMQVSLAVAAMAGGITCWLRSGDVLWLIGAVLIFTVIPFTLLVIMPTNKKLLEPTRDLTSPETATLLARWGKLHAVRSVASLAATAIFLWLVVARNA